MKYNGKEVFTRDNFRYDTARVGDYVDQAVVDAAMDMMPPACMSERCSQIGEPYSYMEEPDTGRVKAVFDTFKKISGEPDGVWEYCGHCFRGENVERGK